MVHFSSLRTPDLLDFLYMVLEQRPHELERALPKKHQFDAIFHHGDELINHSSNYTLQDVHNYVGLTEALADHVSTMVAGTLPEDGGSFITVVNTLAPPKIIAAS